MEKDLDLQEILKPAPLPKKRATKKKTTIVTMKKEDEEGKRPKRLEKIGWMVEFYI